MPRMRCKNEVFIGGPWRVQGGPFHLGGPKGKAHGDGAQGDMTWRLFNGLGPFVIVLRVRIN